MDSGVDIIVRGPDEMLVRLAVEVKLGGDVDAAQSNLAAYMARSRVYVGLLFIGRRLLVLRDTFRETPPQSIEVVSDVSLEGVDELALPPPAEGTGVAARAFAYEAAVQRWLESLRDPGVVEGLPPDVRAIVEEWVLDEITDGDIRATGPRSWPGRSAAGA